MLLASSRHFWLAKDYCLIVFLSDHGEGLGEHLESTHGYFIYQSTLRVPLIIHWPAGAGTYPAQVDEPASLIDVAPSILEFLQVPRPAEFQGRSLLELANSSKQVNPREIFSESAYMLTITLGVVSYTA